MFLTIKGYIIVRTDYTLFSTPITLGCSGFERSVMGCGFNLTCCFKLNKFFLGCIGKVSWCPRLESNFYLNYMFLMLIFNFKLIVYTYRYTFIFGLIAI